MKSLVKASIGGGMELVDIGSIFKSVLIGVLAYAVEINYAPIDIRVDLYYNIRNASTIYPSSKINKT